MASEEIERKMGRTPQKILEALVEKAPRTGGSKLQRTMMEGMRVKVDALHNSLIDRLSRWGDGKKLVPAFLEQMRLGKTAINPSWMAGFRGWMNGFFTNHRFQRYGRPCPWCSHIKQEALVVWNNRRSVPQDDSLEHFHICMIITGICRALDLIPIRRGTTWWDVAITRPFRFGIAKGETFGAGVNVEQISCVRLLDFWGALYNMHNHLRHSDRRYLLHESIRAIRKLLEETHSGAGLWGNRTHGLGTMRSICGVSSQSTEGYAGVRGGEPSEPRNPGGGRDSDSPPLL